MSLTNPRAFEKLNSLLPTEIKNKLWYIPLRNNGKLPEVKAGDKWKLNEKYRLSYSEADNRLKWGSNVGIVAQEGTLMFLDLDVKEGKILASQRFLDALELNQTLTIKSRNGGIQQYFLNDGKYANQLVKENDILIGELRTDWQYVVSVGSHVEPDENCRGEKDGTYRIQKECPISQFQPIAGIDWKRKGNEPAKERKNNHINDHDRPENQRTYAQHLRELLDMGIQRKIRRKVV